MTPEIQEELSQKTPSPFHDELLSHCKQLVKQSRGKMSRHHARWKAQWMAYKGERLPDKEDIRAESRNEPVKMVVPITYTQVNVFIAFLFSVYLQRPNFYELIGTGWEDQKAAKLAEALLQRDLTKNNFITKFNQLFRDLAIYGFGVLKHYWVTETKTTTVTVEGEPSVNPITGEMIPGPVTQQQQKVITFQGNRFANISPFLFYPDTRLPLSRFQEGEFCGSEDVYSAATLAQWEHDGLVAGTKYIDPIRKDMQDHNRWNHFGFDVNEKHIGRGQSQNNVVVTEIQVKLIPSRFLVGGKPMGEEDFPVTYLIQYANDNRIIKCEPLETGHGQFTYDVAEFSPDIHELVNQSLCDTIGLLQDSISWFINSRISNVRKVIQDKLIVDPSMIEMNDLVERRSVIRLKAQAKGRDVRSAIQQLPLSDVTTNHINDITFLNQFVQLTTGISDNSLGQFNSGRRSASEARIVNSAVNSRLKVPARIIWDSCLEPFGRKLNENHRKGLTVEQIVRSTGDIPDVDTAMKFLKVGPQDINGSYDFEIFDGTLPSEKDYRASILQELAVSMLSNPNAIPLVGYDPKKLIYEILVLRGIRSPEQFQLNEEQLNQIVHLLRLTQTKENPIESVKPPSGVPGLSTTATPIPQPEGASPTL